jgi:hypothetical protein
MWSKLEQHLRSVAASSCGALPQAITDALGRITTFDCEGYFRRCGYAIWKAALL